MDSKQVERQIGRGWERAADIAPAKLAEARIQLHCALQLVADVGRKLADDADTEYLPAARGLATGLARGTRPCRAALGIGDLALHLTDAEGQPGTSLRRVSNSGPRNEGLIPMRLVSTVTMGAAGWLQPTTICCSRSSASTQRQSCSALNGYRACGPW